MAHSSPNSSLRLVGITLLMMTLVVPAVSMAQAPPVKYVVTNDGLGGFLDSGGVRIRDEHNRGIKAGDFVIWPSLIMEGRYDTNLLRDQTDGSESPNAVPLLRIVPAFAISNPRPNKLAFSVGAAADARIYLSGDDTIDSHTNVGAKADLRLDILPNGPVTVTVMDVFRRDIDGGAEELDSTFNRNQNRGGLKVAIHPGGGALDISLGYLFNIVFFDDFTDGNYLSHDMQLRASWRFYPKTMAFLEASGSLRDWNSSPKFGGTFVDSNNLRVAAGLSGFFTKRLATLVKVGYGNSFHDEGKSFSHVIGQAELQYKITRGVLLAGGFLRDFRNSFFSNFYAENRSYLRGQFRFWKMGVDLSVAYYLNDYAEYDPAAVDPDGEGGRQHVSHKERRDQVLATHVKLDYNITRWIGVSIGYELKANFTNFIITTLTDHDNNPATADVERKDPYAYIRHQVYGSVNVRY